MHSTVPSIDEALAMLGSVAGGVLGSLGVSPLKGESLGGVVH